MFNKIRAALLKPEIVLLIIGLLAGIPMSIFIPYGAGFDEESHLVRIYDMSRGHLIPNRSNDKGIAFIEFYSLSYKRRYLQTPADNLFQPENFLLKADRFNATDAQTLSTYSPVVFLLEAVIALFAWSILNLPILPVIIFMRIAGLLLYLLLGFLTVRMLPRGKWVMSILLLAPMALYQAATINGDRFTIGAAVFFIAAVLKTYAIKDRPLFHKDTLLLVLASVLIGVSKSGTIILLPLMIILLGHRFEKKNDKWLVAAGILFAIIYSIGWSFLAVMGTKIQSTGTTRNYQALLILHHIPDFLRVYFIGIIHLIPRYYTDWVAEFGYWMGKVPWPVYALFPISLVLAFFTELKSNLFDKKTRWIIALVGLFCLGVIASVKFVWAYVPGQLYYGAQGRYFLPFAPLFFLAFVGLVELTSKWRTTAIVGCIIAIVAALGFYGCGIYRTYYTTCIYKVDSQHPCVLPVYNNLDIQNPVAVPLSSGHTLEQSFDPECAPVDSIDVYVLDIQGNATGTLKLSFYDPNHKFLAESEISIGEIVVGQMNHFKFSPVWTTGSNTYYYTLELSGDNQAVVDFWGVANDMYNKGQLLVNGAPSDAAADLYLQFECPR